MFKTKYAVKDILGSVDEGKMQLYGFYDCSMCVHRDDCPCQWHLNNAACLFIKKARSEPNQDKGAFNVKCKLP